MNRIRILCDNEDVSEYAEAPGWSNVDPGGFEAASFDFSRIVDVPLGAPVLIEENGDFLFEGRVSEVEEEHGGQPSTRVGAEGAGVILKETDHAYIYVDSDVSSGRWRGPSTARRLAIATSGLDYADGFGVVRDDFTGLPGIVLSTRGPWPGAVRNDLWYDAGPVCKVAKLYYDLQNNNHMSLSAADWILELHSSEEDTGSNLTSILTDRMTGTGAFLSDNTYAELSSFHRYLFWFHGYAVAAGTNGRVYELHLRNLRVYGPHALTLRGSDPGGLYTADIVRHAVRDAVGPDLQIFADPWGDFATPQATWNDPVATEQIVSEMATLSGFHWGTWGRITPDGKPTFVYQQRPFSPTCWLSAQEADTFKVARSLSSTYNVAKVSYNDPAAGPGVVVVTRAVEALDRRGINRVLPVNMGPGTSATATLYGQMLLELSDLIAGATGQFTMRQRIGHYTGGSKAAHALQAGRDRVAFTDLGSEFHVQRVEARADREGVSTTVELGRGAQLIEVLNARLALANMLAGAG